MKRIDIDDDLYAYIASHTREIGESASDILRRLLDVETTRTLEPAKPEKVKTETVFNRLNEQDVRVQKSVVARFLYILSMLYKVTVTVLLKCWTYAVGTVSTLRAPKTLY